VKNGQDMVTTKPNYSLLQQYGDNWQCYLLFLIGEIKSAVVYKGLETCNGYRALYKFHILLSDIFIEKQKTAMRLL